MFGNSKTQEHIYLHHQKCQKTGIFPKNAQLFPPCAVSCWPSTVHITLPHDLRLEAVAHGFAQAGAQAALLAHGPGEARRDEGLEDRGPARVVAVQVLAK